MFVYQGSICIPLRVQGVRNKTRELDGVTRRAVRRVSWRRSVRRRLILLVALARDGRWTAWWLVAACRCATVVLAHRLAVLTAVLTLIVTLAVRWLSARVKMSEHLAETRDDR